MNQITKALSDATSTLLSRKAEVTSVLEHGPHFRSIELTGDALRRARWKRGDKVQLRVVPDALTTRAYTPMEWNTARGTTKLLVYSHGLGPGSAWIRNAVAGTPCQIFGPQTSLRLDDVSAPIIFVGDETSFGLVAAWRSRETEAPPAGAQLFEVNEPEESRAVLAAVGLPLARLIRRQEGSGHLEELAAATVDLARTYDDASLCITGKAQTIAAVRHHLKTTGLSGRPTRVKAYWDEQRSGLD